MKLPHAPDAEDGPGRPVDAAELGDNGDPDDARDPDPCVERVLGEAGDDPVIDDGAPAGFDAWRRRSAAGGVGTAIARGLSAVFSPTENRPVVSAPVPGDPPDSDLGFRVLLDPDDPTKSIALFAAPAEAESEDPDAGEIAPTGASEHPGD